MRLWDAHTLREMYLSHLASICQSETRGGEAVFFLTCLQKMFCMFSLSLLQIVISYLGFCFDVFFLCANITVGWKISTQGGQVKLQYSAL